MGDIAIRVDNLSKQYRIGAQISNRTLRDALVSIIRTPFARLKDGTPERENTIWALNDVSFEIKKGEAVGFIGRNGAGKSTLLKIISRITKPTIGRLELFGRIGSLLEVGTGFHSELTGRENIYLSGAILGMRQTEIRRKFDEIVAFSEIEKFLDTQVKYYSSGMYVRLGFAVAAHLEPEILIVDEVLSVGDLNFQKKCLSKLSALQHNGCTTLLVTHNVSLLPGMASQVIWLESGHLTEIGNPGTVVSNYFRHMSNVSAEESLVGVEQTPDIKPSLVPEGEIVCDPPEGRDGVQLIRAFIADENFTILKNVDYEKPFNFVVEYAVKIHTEGLRIGFRLHNEKNQAVVHSTTFDAYPSLDNALIGMTGNYRISTQLPGKWFIPGKYVMEIGLWSPVSLHHFYRPDALTFSIVNCPLDSIGMETCRPRLSWTISKTE